MFGIPDVDFRVTGLLFLGLVVCSPYLAQRTFSHYFPATCPACGGATAVPSLRFGHLYVCRACRAENSAPEAMLGEPFGSMQPRPGHTGKGEIPLLSVFVLVGLGCVGAGIWLAHGTIGLLRDGIITDAKVIRVTQQDTRDSKNRRETSYTALIQYQADDSTETLTTGWSVRDGASCTGRCYSEGQLLRVIYVPEEPGRAKVHASEELYAAPVMFSGVGLLFTVFGLVAIRQRRRLPKGRP